MRRGFTLIEVLLAMTLLAVLIGIVQGAYSGAARSRTISREETREAHASALVLQRLAEELSMCLFSDTRKDVTGLTVDTDGDGNSVLVFTTRVPPISGYSVGGEARLRYAVSQEDESVDLVRQETPDPKADIENAVVPYQVLQNVARFEVLCYDGEQWLTTWDSADRPSAPYLPLAVSVEVAYKHGEEEAERVYRTSTPLYAATR